MTDHHHVPKNRRPVALAAGLGILILIGALLISIDRVAGQATLTAGATPAPATPSPLVTSSPAQSPASTGAPTAAAAQIPFADCTKQQFGPPMQPLNPPADVHKYAAAPAMQIAVAKLYQMSIATAKGTITVCLQPELAPNTVNVMVALARNHFFDNLTFHRVVADFVIQGGDPAGTGSGGPGFAFKDEPVRQHYVVGAVAMANSGVNTNGSQFFICTGAQCPPLAPSYNLFGHVSRGLDVAKKIAQGDVMTAVTVAEQG